MKNHRGVIIQTTSPVSYRVEMADRNIIRSHQDHIWRRFTEVLQPGEDEDDLLSQISENSSLADADVPHPGPNRHDGEAADPTPAIGFSPRPDPDHPTLSPPISPASTVESSTTPQTPAPQPRRRLVRRQVMPSKVYPGRDH